MFRRHKIKTHYDTSQEIFDTDIKNGKHTKYLGVHLDDRLNFHEHIRKTVAKATGASISLNPLIGRDSKMTLKNKITLYKTMIRPVLLYASPAWAAVHKHHRKKLQVFQNKALRRMTDAPWFVRNLILHRDLGIDTIDTAILSALHNYNTQLQNSIYDNIRQIGDYDPIVEQKHKRPRTIHHDPDW